MSNPQLVLHKHLLLESPTLCIYYDTHSDWIYMDWLGEQTVDSVKEGCEKLLTFIVSERCHKVLNDNTRVTNIWSDAAIWVALDIFPRAEKAGLQYLAWIYSPDQFSRLSTDEVLVRQTASIIVVPFNCYEEASNWLAAV